MRVQYGPAQMWVKSTTLRPSNGRRPSSWPSLWPIRSPRGGREEPPCSPNSGARRETNGVLDILNGAPGIVTLPATGCRTRTKKRRCLSCGDSSRSRAVAT